MSVSLLLLNSLAAAGFHTPPSETPFPAVHTPGATDNPGRVERRYLLEQPFTLAGHRSHSSHRSHGSHRSSSGGGYVPSTPSPGPARPSTGRNTDSTPPSSVLPSSPSTAPGGNGSRAIQDGAASGVPALRGNTKAFKTLAMQVQLALFAKGYYTGAIDGIVGPGTAAAISGFQRDAGLPVTGRVNNELLNALNIQIPR